MTLVADKGLPLGLLPKSKYCWMGGVGILTKFLSISYPCPQAGSSLSAYCGPTARLVDLSGHDLFGQGTLVLNPQR